MRGLGCSRPRTPKRRLSVPEPRPRTDRNARAPSGVGSGARGGFPNQPRFSGGRVRRAARGAAQKMRGARVVLFRQQKRPFLPTQHGKGREGDEDGGGLDVRPPKRCGFEERRGFLGYAQLVRLAPILIEIERLVCFGFGFGPPRADGKNSGRGNLPNSRRTRRATRLFPD